MLPLPLLPPLLLLGEAVFLGDATRGGAVGRGPVVEASASIAVASGEAVTLRPGRAVLAEDFSGSLGAVRVLDARDGAKLLGLESRGRVLVQRHLQPQRRRVGPGVLHLKLNPRPLAWRRRGL